MAWPSGQPLFKLHVQINRWGGIFGGAVCTGSVQSVLCTAINDGEEMSNTNDKCMDSTEMVLFRICTAPGAGL